MSRTNVWPNFIVHEWNEHVCICTVYELAESAMDTAVAALASERAWLPMPKNFMSTHEVT